jgi:hypothetical protein
VTSEQPDPIDLDSLTFTDEPVIDLPPIAGPDDFTVTRNHRLPFELDQWITHTASAKGIDPSTLVRDLLELGRASYQGADRSVSLADVLAAVASIRSPDTASRPR